MEVPYLRVVGDRLGDEWGDLVGLLVGDGGRWSCRHGDVARCSGSGFDLRRRVVRKYV